MPTYKSMPETLNTPITATKSAEIKLWPWRRSYTVEKSNSIFNRYMNAVRTVVNDTVETLVVNGDDKRITGFDFRSKDGSVQGNVFYIPRDYESDDQILFTLRFNPDGMPAAEAEKKYVALKNAVEGV